MRIEIKTKTRIEQLIEMGADKFLEQAAQGSKLTDFDQLNCIKLGAATASIDILITLLKLERKQSNALKELIKNKIEKLNK